MTHADRVEGVRRRIATACASVGRSPSEVMLVAVSKTFGADAILGVLDAGVRDLGENRAQELKEKALLFGDRVAWHFIGPLQTNKVRHVVGTAELIHSVDRIGLAAEISRRAASAGLVQDVLIEVNIAGESSKQGVEPPAAIALAKEVDLLDAVRVRGLMTIAPFAEDPDASRPYFRDLADLGSSLREDLPEATELSMGMTRDLEVAVEEGATIVRVGEAIFGPRNSR